jgi:hypothetical protein
MQLMHIGMMIFMMMHVCLVFGMRLPVITDEILDTYKNT